MTPSGAGPAEAARSVLLRGGSVYAHARTPATAMLVVGDRIGWIGPDDAAAAHTGSADQVIELDGALITPAFVDAHVHTTETGLALTGLDLHDVRSLAEALRRVEDAARRGGGRPILGTGWDEHDWPERRAPTRQELDRASYGGAVYLARVDVHSAVVSSALAAAAGLRQRDGWSDDGRVERDAHHAARDATRATIGPARRAELQRRALQAAGAAGIALLHEMSAPHIAAAEDLRSLLALTCSEALPQVIGYRGELVQDEGEARALVSRLALPGPNGLAGLAGDLCADGSIGSRTAALRSPYRDAPGRGNHYLGADQVRDHVVACTRAGLQAGFHVIGDAALDTVLDGLRTAAAVVGGGVLRAARHRLEHVEMPDARAVAELSRLGVLASVQPAFDAAWGGAHRLYAERLGAGRALAMNPFAGLTAAGVPLALGSDSPVTPFGPWAAVRAAAFPQVPEHRIDVAAGFAAHTRGGRLAAGLDDPGDLRPGAPATYAVWDAGSLPGLPDLTPGRDLPRCLRTVVSGRTVFAAEGAL